jgi:hypothetical protein
MNHKEAIEAVMQFYNCTKETAFAVYADEIEAYAFLNKLANDSQQLGLYDDV